VQYFRDRWESSSLGTFIFVLTALMLIPYIIIGVMGGGTTLEAISATKNADGTMSHFVSYEVGGAIVAVVVMSYVFFGGMRGTAWVNTFQTTLFLIFGTVAFVLIGRKLGGFGEIMNKIAANPKTAPLLTRERIPPGEFLSYMLIPFSTIMFPHIAITCFSAEKVTHFKRTVIWYPICIMAIWLPSVYLGVVASQQFPGLKPGETDDVILRLLAAYTGDITAGLLGAGIMACVMASDSQILALCTMFTEDIFVHFGGRQRFGEKAQIWTGRLFIVGISVFAYGVALALKKEANIFELAIRFAFSGYAALAPVMVAALFWKRSTKGGAWAATLWVAGTTLLLWWMQQKSSGIAPPPGKLPVPIFPALGAMFLRSTAGVTFYDFLPVLPMFVGSALLVVIGSLLTAPPSRATVEKYFPG
jgi:SSS family solute:Na+ symporter